MDDEQIEQIERALWAIGNAITPRGTAPGTDACGGSVDSLTEAVMGQTAGLVSIANAISELAEAVRESRESPTET